MPTTGRCRGEGSKSLGSLGSVTAPGVSSQNLEIQFEKPTPGLFTSHPRSQGKAHQCDPDAPGLCTQIWKLKQKPTARVGVVKSLEFSIADRAAPPHAYPQNSGAFLLVVDAHDSSAADDCCGEVSRSNRGSFLVARSNAGGNRARGR